jgi:hypothetical protein
MKGDGQHLGNPAEDHLSPLTAWSCPYSTDLYSAATCMKRKGAQVHGDVRMHAYTANQQYYNRRLKLI